MRVVMIFEFPDITDSDVEEATEIVDSLTLDTVRIAEEWADKRASVYIDNVEQ